MQRDRWQDWAIFLLGVWLLLSPFWMDVYASPTGAAAWNAYILGALVSAMGWASLVRPRDWQQRVNLGLGIWLVVAPFLLGFFASEPGAGWSQLIVGVLVGGDALAILAQPAGRRVRT